LSNALLSGGTAVRVDGVDPVLAYAAFTREDLNRETDNQLEQTVRSLIPNVQADGSFVLPARALAVAGVKT
jgi:hypothetical protein